MMNKTFPRARPALLLATLLLGGASAQAEGRGAPLALLPLYQQECGSCHVPFAPGLLPAASWQRLMQGLPKHFGSDASLDAAPAREIAAWLAQHAGSSKKVQRDATPPPQDRISMAPWFVREHREVSAATWKLAAVKSPANCAACHPRAEQGAFDERDIRIPR